MLRLRTERPRFSLPETALVIIVAAALGAGIYAMLHMLERNKQADQALTTLAYIEQNFASASTQTQTDPWGRPVDIVSTADNFSLTFSAVPRGACKHIAKHFDRNQPAYISLSINSTVFREGAEEVNARTIARACTEGDKAIMIWTFSRNV